MKKQIIIHELDEIDIQRRDFTQQLPWEYNHSKNEY